jgi:hypothetical protein
MKGNRGKITQGTLVLACTDIDTGHEDKVNHMMESTNANNKPDNILRYSETGKCVNGHGTSRTHKCDDGSNTEDSKIQRSHNRNTVHVEWKNKGEQIEISQNYSENKVLM